MTNDMAGWYSDDTATFGDRLADARVAAGLDQQELARRLGIRLKTLQAWETDTDEPRANKLQMVSGLLNVSVVWLLTGEGSGLEAPQPAPRAELEPLFAEMRDLRELLNEAATRLGQLEGDLRTALRGDT